MLELMSVVVLVDTSISAAQNTRCSGLRMGRAAEACQRSPWAGKHFWFTSLTGSMSGRSGLSAILLVVSSEVNGFL